MIYNLPNSLLKKNKKIFNKNSLSNEKKRVDSQDNTILASEKSTLVALEKDSLMALGKKMENVSYLQKIYLSLKNFFFQLEISFLCLPYFLYYLIIY